MEDRKLYWVFYDDDGRITQRSSKTLMPLCYDEWVGDRNIIQTTGPEIKADTHFIDIATGTITERAEILAEFNETSITADGEDKAMLFGLPQPCTVYVDGESVVVDDGIFVMTADDPGDYVIVVDEVTHQRKEWAIDAV
jgi:hypothetical protein